jgi:hypothetical protein
MIRRSRSERVARRMILADSDLVSVPRAYRRPSSSGPHRGALHRTRSRRPGWRLTRSPRRRRRGVRRFQQDARPHPERNAMASRLGVANDADDREHHPAHDQEPRDPRDQGSGTKVSGRAELRRRLGGEGIHIERLHHHSCCDRRDTGGDGALPLALAPRIATHIPRIPAAAQHRKSISGSLPAPAPRTM